MTLIVLMFAALIVPPGYVLVSGWMRGRKLARMSPLERAQFDLAEIQAALRDFRS